MTMGNAYLIGCLAEFCVYNFVIGYNKHKELDWLHTNAVPHLKTCQIDGILGIAFGHFDRLGSVEQYVLKTIAALQLDAFSAGHIYACIDEHHEKMKDKKRVLATLDNLAKKGILAKVEPYIDHYKPDRYLVDKDPCYAFTALFFRLAAEKLVLKAQYVEMRSRKVQLGVSSITLLDAKQAMQSTGGGGNGGGGANGGNGAAKK